MGSSGLSSSSFPAPPALLSNLAGSGFLSGSGTDLERFGSTSMVSSSCDIVDADVDVGVAAGRRVGRVEIL